eukprot:CAMPEP_0171594020 /NCGR_PEP_ID=MMETSP0990-20121206/450_1 /TAXON_ID=483369 /ORGANISM="non described non described, Strain CCMP2098" /LENGTH=50 /DNA_ID=CAMNT_0012154649 /DNA_START=436 /DNA_END=591 /DNA_ORIENTATION=+
MPATRRATIRNSAKNPTRTILKAETVIAALTPFTYNHVPDSNAENSNDIE